MLSAHEQPKHPGKSKEKWRTEAAIMCNSNRRMKTELDVYSPPTDPQAYFTKICCFKLKESISCLSNKVHSQSLDRK